MNARPLAVVTGASTGIGRELARLCVENGFDLVLAADDPAIEDAARELRAAGAAVDALEVDLAALDGVDPTPIEALVRVKQRLADKP